MPLPDGDAPWSPNASGSGSGSALAAITAPLVQRLRGPPGGFYLRSTVPVHDDRSRVHEMRVAGVAIALATLALILVVIYVVGGFVGRVVIRFG
jgi:hypothetical protein